MRVEDGQLVPLVFEEEIRGITRPQLEPVGAPQCVLAGQVPLGDLVAERDEPARFVRGL
jgi:hypothetical protein